MSFGRNPYVAKAQTAEQKALDATDESTRVRARRDAAHEWDRAAAREKPGKRRDEYLEHAQRNREIADGESAGGSAGHEPVAKPPVDDTFLN